MSTLEAAFKGAPGPYAKAAKVKVVARGEPVTYRGADGSDRGYLTVAVSDGKICTKCMVYDAGKYAKFALHNTLVLRDFIKKEEEAKKSIVVTKTTKAFVSTSIIVPEEHIAEGNQIINPPAADVVDIKTALRSPLRTKISVSGTIVQEEAVKTVKVKGEEIPIKKITIEDATGTAKITLWREASNTPFININSREYITVTDCITNSWNNETTLSTTVRSTVRVTEAPLVEETVTVCGVSVETDSTELLLDNDNIVIVPSELLVNALPTDNVEELVLSGPPLKLLISRRGTEVTDISAVSMD